jgi:23S rRNA pseudouridine2605 synthase
MSDQEDTIRLEKYLALSGIASRRKSKEIVESGRITVNDKKVFIPGTRIIPENDIVKFDGEEVIIDRELVYIMLNKPKGYICTVEDELNRHTVLDLLPDMEQRIYPVGRLDMDTEGLLLLTNDGKLTHKLTHPRYQIDKVYIAWVEGEPDEQSLGRLRKGIRIETGLTSPAKVKVLQKAGGNTELEIIIHEGMKRQIRRMCREVGHEVLHLRRIQIGSIKVGRLPIGKYRFLSGEEIKKLKSAIGSTASTI